MTRNISSVLEDDPYEEIESLEAHTDEDASTVSVEDSALGDYSNADTLSDFAYDSEGHNESEDDANMEEHLSVVNASAVPTPLGLSRLENEHLATDSLFTSTHTETTEKWQAVDAHSSLPLHRSSSSAQSSSWHHKFQEFVLKLKTIPRLQPVIAAFDGINNPGSIVGYVAAIVLAGLVAAAMRSVVYTVLTTSLQTSSKVASAMAGEPIAADYINVVHREPVSQHNHYSVKSWAKFETLQQTREMLSRLANSQADPESGKDSLAIASEQSQASKRPVIENSAVAALASSTKALELSRKFLSSTKRSFSGERFYVAMRSGQLLKAEQGPRRPNADLLGPLKRIEASKEQFKTTYDKEEGRIKVARAGTPTGRTPAQIVVRSGNRVIQRGNLNSANVLHWTPAVIPESQRAGEVRVVFVLPTEALVQEHVLDLGNMLTVDSTATQQSELIGNIADCKIAFQRILSSISQHVCGQNLTHHFVDRADNFQKMSFILIKRAQVHAAQVDRRVQLYMKQIDDKFSTFWNERGAKLAGVFQEEVVMRTKRAQGRSKNLRYTLEQKIKDVYAAQDRFKAVGIRQESIVGWWKKLLQLV